MSEESGLRHEDEIDVIAQGAKDLKVRMYSTAVVAQQFFSKMCAAKEQEDKDPDAVRQRLDCHKQLLNLRAMNVKVEHGEEEGDSSRREEELQEWLEGIEARKKAHQASKKSEKSKGTVKRSSTVPDRLNTQRSNVSTRSRNQGANGTVSRTKAASNNTTRDSVRAKPTERQADGNVPRPERKVSTKGSVMSLTGHSIG